MYRCLSTLRGRQVDVSSANFRSFEASCVQHMGGFEKRVATFVDSHSKGGCGVPKN